MSNDQTPAADRGSGLTDLLGPMQTYIPRVLHDLMNAASADHDTEGPFYDALGAIRRYGDSLVAAERERCAQICENMRSEPTLFQGELEYRVSEKAYEVAQECARDIRGVCP